MVWNSITSAYEELVIGGPTGPPGPTGPGSTLQVVNYQTGAFATGTTIIPNDDTIPQNTEGTEFMSLAFTPVSASSNLLIQASATLSHGIADHMFVALFVDSTANALAANFATLATGNLAVILTLNHYVASASTAARTYKIRAGSGSAGTTAFNGMASRKMGGVQSSFIRITEIAA